ncbi:hypothetical protein LshimejAT787_0506750 [Lyophyllum shimeji]|uniref:Uncharacterized protein n=1 Tax=Lyophyllum shimeji TaxID=47721 RepID=A0A9P3PMV8_LYOSH|nr:hypothetical protein LshimejAT787_0506750 [Lyophyllum shimeji]
MIAQQKALFDSLSSRTGKDATQGLGLTRSSRINETPTTTGLKRQALARSLKHPGSSALLISALRSSTLLKARPG